MKNTRRGLGKGLGTGYKNLAPMDSHIHSLSAKGVKSLHIEPTYVPRGSGNNPYGGKRDLHYKIKEWGFIFPTKESAEKYADEHIEINGGEIIEKKNLNAKGDDRYLMTKKISGEDLTRKQAKDFLISKGYDKIKVSRLSDDSLMVSYDIAKRRKDLSAKGKESRFDRFVHDQIDEWSDIEIEEQDKLIEKYEKERDVIGWTSDGKVTTEMKKILEKEENIVFEDGDFSDELFAKSKKITKPKKERYLGSLRYQYGNKARELSRKLFDKNIEDLTTEEEYDTLFRKLHSSGNLNAKGISKAKVFYSKKHQTELPKALYDDLHSNKSTIFMPKRIFKDVYAEMSKDKVQIDGDVLPAELERMFAKYNDDGYAQDKPYSKGKNPLATPKGQDKVRDSGTHHTSMSVGDMVEVDGDHYIVADFGFKKVKVIWDEKK